MRENAKQQIISRQKPESVLGILDRFGVDKLSELEIVMVFLIVSIVSGVVGGVFVSQFMKEYDLGILGNMVTGFLGGATAHSLMLYSLGGSEYSVAVVSGFIFGVISRSAFTVLRRRTSK